MAFLKSILVVLVSLVMAGCGSINANKYRNEGPEFSLRDYFEGSIKAWGIVQDRSGNVIQRFDIDLVGSWDGNVGTLEEDFVFYSGKKERRVWIITDLGNGQYKGEAGDIVGTAKGSTVGNSGNWSYQMDIGVAGSSYRLIFDDWMWLMNDGVLMNRSYMKKFGITVGEITIFMQKQS